MYQVPRYSSLLLFMICTPQTGYNGCCCWTKEALGKIQGNKPCFRKRTTYRTDDVVIVLVYRYRELLPGIRTGNNDQSTTRDTIIIIIIIIVEEVRHFFSEAGSLACLTSSAPSHPETDFEPKLKLRSD